MAKKKASRKAAPKQTTAQKKQKKRSVPRQTAPRNKTETCLALLMRPEGATLEDLHRVTGWLPHSIRGFLAGKVKKMPGLVLAAEKPPDGPRRYRVTAAPERARNHKSN